MLHYATVLKKRCKFIVIVTKIYGEGQSISINLAGDMIYTVKIHWTTNDGSNHRIALIGGKSAKNIKYKILLLNINLWMSY